ncbi:hypothetical protein [Maribacter sp. 2-571]|uniref:hypothetical protein n=1 Tax=Maribacter sp. 2-571 TaxID=3417569 RepID=UPI003D3354C9
MTFRKAPLFFFLTGLSLVTSAQQRQSERVTDTIILDNGLLTIVQDLKGGAITALRLKDNALNPFDWTLDVAKQPEINKNGFPFQGHFISLGTWGMPTKGEQQAGIRLYGEANGTIWQLDSISPHYARTGFKGNIEKLDFERSLQLYANAPAVKVTETITNRHPIARMYNMLQHATFGGAFSDKNLILDSNAGAGIYQKGAYPRVSYDSLEQRSFRWPNGILPDGPIDLRTSGNRKKTYLTSHVFDSTDSLGWATAINAEKGLLVGYVWHTREYPWLNVWHQYRDGKQYGRALEFATCGLGLDFIRLASGDYRFYGQNSFEFIDAGQHRTKSYTLFAIAIPKEVTAVDTVTLHSNILDITYIKNGEPITTTITLE